MTTQVSTPLIEQIDQAANTASKQRPTFDAGAAAGFQAAFDGVSLKPPEGTSAGSSAVLKKVLAAHEATLNQALAPLPDDLSSLDKVEAMRTITQKSIEVGKAQTAMHFMDLGAKAVKKSIETVLNSK